MSSSKGASAHLCLYVGGLIFRLIESINKRMNCILREHNRGLQLLYLVVSAHCHSLTGTGPSL